MNSKAIGRPALGARIGKALARGFLGVYRTVFQLTGGKVGGSMMGMPVLLLTTTGRKTGKVRTWPVAYFRDAGNFVVAGSNNGAPRDPAWCFNLRSNPIAKVQVGAEEMTVRAEQVSGEERRRLWNMVVAQAPRFGGYEQKTTREIPIMVLRPTASA